VPIANGVWWVEGMLVVVGSKCLSSTQSSTWSMERSDLWLALNTLLVCSVIERLLSVRGQKPGAQVNLKEGEIRLLW
jgi:hypothetical protein